MFKTSNYLSSYKSLRETLRFKNYFETFCFDIPGEDIYFMEISQEHVEKYVPRGSAT